MSPLNLRNYFYRVAPEHSIQLFIAGEVKGILNMSVWHGLYIYMTTAQNTSLVNSRLPKGCSWDKPIQYLYLIDQWGWSPLHASQRNCDAFNSLTPMTREQFSKEYGENFKKVTEFGPFEVTPQKFESCIDLIILKLQKH